MDAQIKRIISEVAQGSAEWANRHKKVIGGVGAAGAAGAFGGDSAMDMARKGFGLGRRVMGLGEALEKAEGTDEESLPQIPDIQSALAMPDYREKQREFPSVHPETLRYRP